MESAARGVDPDFYIHDSVSQQRQAKVGGALQFLFPFREVTDKV